MVPIVDGTISGERISIFNPSSGFANPYNGIRFTNSTGIDLSAGDEFIQAYIDAEEVDARVKASLRGILERRQAISESVTARNVQENRRSVIYREQDRIRKNMVNLAEETDLYKRYVETLSNQEIELRELGSRIDELLAREQEQRAEHERYVRSIQFS